jgi:hypothetical protein
VGDTTGLRQVSLKMDKALFEQVRAEARASHRSVSGQIAFFCAQSVGKGNTKTDGGGQ